MRTLVFSGVVIFLTGCGGRVVRVDTPNTVKFYFPPTELKSHILTAALLLLLVLLLPYIIKVPNRFKKAVYLLVLSALLLSSVVNIYLYFAKRSFSLEIANDGITVNDIRGTKRFAWDELFEVVQTTRLGFELPKWIPLSNENRCFKFKTGKEHKTSVVIPDAFSVEDRDFFLKLLLARNVIVSKEVRLPK